MRRRFATLDVFTLKRFSGNPLAVVFEPEGLETGAMQAIAREFNYPETVFVLPAQDNAHRAKLRIFTPAAELPFAGHPTVGTAVALARAQGGDEQRFIVEEGIGPITCRVHANDAAGGRASFDLPRMPQQTAPAPDAASMAAALGLSPADIDSDRFRPARWSAGTTFTFVPVTGLASIGRARSDKVAFDRVFGSGVDGMVYLFCRETAQADCNFHVRMFAPGIGITEDAATGSAAAAFMGVLAAQDGLADGRHTIRLEQGLEMGRPSQIDLTIKIANGKLTGGSIGGGAVIVCEGNIEA